MAKPSKTTFVCQNCGSTSPRWAGKCPACGEWNTLTEETDAIAPPGTGLSPPQQRPRHRARRPQGYRRRRRRASRPASANWTASPAAASSRDRRCSSAASPASANRRCCCSSRPRWRAPAGARSISPAKRRRRRCACAPSASACRMRRSPSPARRALRISWRRSKPDRRPISSSSIPSRRCGPKPSRRRPAPSARCAPPRRR